MQKRFILVLALFFSFSLGQYDYSLEDINSSSEHYGEDVGASYFPNQITLHYFGHYN